jgi:TolB protein
MAVVRARLAAFALAGSSIATLVLVASGHAAYPGTNGKLAIEGDTRPGIWTVKPSGKDLTRITGKKGLPFAPSWSPDGRWIAFTQFNNLWKMRADGSHRQKLAKGVGGSIQTNVSWSPDGRKLVFDKKDDLWRVRANGTHAKRITNTAEIEQSPTWSPKGGEIAFRFDDPNSTVDELRLIQPNGAGEKAIPNTKFGLEPDWSPNGQRLVYAKQAALFTINPDGSGQTTFVMPKGQRIAVDPAWSPDGNQIAYALLVNEDDTRIIRKPLAGGNAHVVVRHRHWFSPSWQPR